MAEPPRSAPIFTGALLRMGLDLIDEGFRRVTRPASAACSSISIWPNGLAPMMSSMRRSTKELGPQPKFVSTRPYRCGVAAVSAAAAICRLS